MALVNGVKLHQQMGLYTKHSLVEMGSLDLQVYESSKCEEGESTLYTHWLILAMEDMDNPDAEYIVVYACDSDSEYMEEDEAYAGWVAGHEGRTYDQAVTDAERGALFV